VFETEKTDSPFLPPWLSSTLIVQVYLISFVVKIIPTLFHSQSGKFPALHAGTPEESLRLSHQNAEARLSRLLIEKGNFPGTFLASMGLSCVVDVEATKILKATVSRILMFI